MRFEKTLQKRLVKTYLVTCVRTPPRTRETTAPIGAPAENVANAIEREGPGGNALARIPSWCKVKVCEQTTRRILTEAGITAAEPIPCNPRRISSALAAVVHRKRENDISKPFETRTERTLSEARSDAKRYQNQVSNKPHSLTTVQVCQSSTEKKETRLWGG